MSFGITADTVWGVTDEEWDALSEQAQFAVRDVFEAAYYRHWSFGGNVVASHRAAAVEVRQLLPELQRGVPVGWALAADTTG